MERDGSGVSALVGSRGSSRPPSWPTRSRSCAGTSQRARRSRPAAPRRLPRAELTVESVQYPGRRCHAVEADLTGHDAGALVVRTEDAVGCVSNLVTNASRWRGTFSRWPRWQSWPVALRRCCAATSCAAQL